jgi:uncharacterized membrane protein YbhN (UPF0104 family)
MRRLLSFTVKFGLSAALLYFALSKVSFSVLWSRLNDYSLGWIAVAIAVYLLQLYSTALRWRYISASCDAPLSRSQAMQFTLIGSFFNQVLPSSIGGDAVRLLLLSRSGAGWRASVYSVLVDRAIGLIALALIVILSLPWSLQLIGDFRGRVALTLIDLAALAGCAAFLAFGAIRWRHSRWPLANHLHACSVVASKILFEDAMRLRIWLLALVGQLLTVVILWAVAQSIGAAVGILDILLLVPPVLLITILPISIAGWGVRETAMMTAFGYAGLAQDDGLNLSLVFGAVSLLIGVIGGLALILNKANRT